MSDIKDRAMAIYKEHIALASTDGKLFRKTVREQLIDEFKISHASASTYYNVCKKEHPPIEGLGRAPAPAGLRTPGKNISQEVEQDDDDCFTVIEIVEGNVSRCYPYAMQGDASESFDSKIITWSKSEWVMIQGLGPNCGEHYSLSRNEKEIKHHTPATLLEETVA